MFRFTVRNGVKAVILSWLVASVAAATPPASTSCVEEARAIVLGTAPARLGQVEALAALQGRDLVRAIREMGPERAVEVALDALAFHNGALPGNLSEAAKGRLRELITAIGRIAGAEAPDRAALARRLFEAARRFPFDWEKQHGLNILTDAVLGLRGDRVTRQVASQPDSVIQARYGNEQTWFRFGNEDLLTPYFEFELLLEHLRPQPGQTFVDLGSGLGRQGLYMGIMHPDVRFIGYEIVKERVAEGQRAGRDLGLRNVHFHEQNLADPTFRPEPADFYYAFNPVSGATFDKILADIRAQAIKHNKPFKIAVSGPAPYEKLERAPGFREVTPPPRFPGDDFVRIFAFDPARPHDVAPPREVASATRIPRFPDDRPLRAEDQQAVADALRRAPTPFSHLDFAPLWAWNGRDEYRVTEILGLTVISGRLRDRRVFLEPLGGTAKEKAAAIRFAILATKPGEEPPHFTYVSKEVADILAKDPLFRVNAEPTISDYIYRTEGLAELAVPEGQPANRDTRKRLKEKAQQADAFAQRYPEARFQTFDARSDLRPKVRAFLEKWERDNAERIGEEGCRECRASGVMLDRMEALGLEGHALVVDGEVVAFSLGKRLNDSTFVMYVNKADLSRSPDDAKVQRYPGIYPYFLRETARDMRRRGVSHMNLQDDDGDPHLRQAKRALNPESQVETFSVQRATSVASNGEAPR